MSFFSAALDRLLPEHDMSPADLARKTDIAASLISRYRAGTQPEPENLEKIADAFGPDRGELVAAWLRDSLPEKYRSVVAVTPTSGSGRDRAVAPTPWEQLGAKERRVFERLAAKCVANPKLLPLLEQVLSAT